MKNFITIKALSDKAAKGARILAEYQRATDDAIRSTEGKGMECTKYAYAFGIDCEANLATFTELLRQEGVIGKKYQGQYHFHYVTKLFAKIAGITVNSGEVSRIALVCAHLHAAGISPDDLSAWFEQVGGLRKAYQLTVRQRDDKPANDNEPVDQNLRFQVIGAKGFLGILNITPRIATKLYRRYGVTEVVGGNGAANDNTNNERKINHA